MNRISFQYILAQPFARVFDQIDLKFAAFTINAVELKIGEGNLTYSEKRTIEYTLDRGTLDEVREGDEVPVDVSFDLVWAEMSGGSIKDQITGKTGAVSSDTDACRPYACDINIAFVPLPSGCGASSAVVLPDFRHEDLAHDMRAGTIAVTGKCNATEVEVT